MLNWISFFAISNLISAAIVVGVEQTTGFFGLKFMSDYAFFVVLILWGTAALFFMYPPGAAGGDKAEKAAGSMVDSSVAHDIDDERFSSNTIFCIKLIASGLPAFLVCVAT